MQACFVYGRTRSKRDENTGKFDSVCCRTDQWRIVVRDRYPAYISWETYEKIH